MNLKEMLEKKDSIKEEVISNLNNFIIVNSVDIGLILEEDVVVNIYFNNVDTELVFSFKKQNEQCGKYCLIYSIVDNKFYVSEVISGYLNLYKSSNLVLTLHKLFIIKEKQFLEIVNKEYWKRSG